MIQNRVEFGERDTYYHDSINDVINYILTKNYGETLTNKELADMLGFNIELVEEYDKFKEKMTRIKRYLITKGYVLKGIVGVGYYILKPKQVSGYVYHTYTRKINNLLNNGVEILNYTPKSDLSGDRLMEIKQLTDLNEDLIENVKDTIKDSLYYQNKSYYDNLDD